MVQGYDIEKEAIMPCTLPRDHEGEQTERLQLTPPIGGIHKYTKHQMLYECMHALLADRTWRWISDDEEKGSIIWLELIVLFDTQGYRKGNVESFDSTVGQQRARQRNKAIVGRACVQRATLRDGLRGLKSIVRFIVRNDVGEYQHGRFKLDAKLYLRRATCFATIGHQPAIKAWCSTTGGEDKSIENYHKTKDSWQHQTLGDDPGS